MIASSDESTVPPSKRPEYLTPGQAASMLHVSPKTVNRWAHEGRIPYIVTLGGHRRFASDDIDAIVAQMRRRGAPLDE